MSETDTFRHECMGMLSCPSSFLPAAYWRHPEKVIPIYRLHEDAFRADSFSGKKGDLLLGGGSGECPALRISIPEAFHIFAHDDTEIEELPEEFYKANWSMNDAFVFGDGYFRLGWRPNEEPIEVWLAEHILAFVIREYPDDYGLWEGMLALGKDGSICRKPTPEERKL